MGTLVSIITPTANRGRMLGRLLDVVQRQDHTDLEWLVLDDGDAPCEALRRCTDDRVAYDYSRTPRTLGAKRNELVARAAGEVIVQFDDDDYYAPHYVSAMLAHLEREGADFTKLSAFFVYHALLRKFGYWDLYDLHGHHFIWGSQTAACTLFEGTAGTGFNNLHLSFGFSYVFRRRVWEAIPFEERDFGEDGHFIEAAIAAGHPCALLADHTGLCVHVMHAFNTSKSFPQYVVPDFLAERALPGFDKAAYIAMNRKDGAAR